MSYEQDLEQQLSNIRNLFKTDSQWMYYRLSTLNDIMLAQVKFLIENEDEDNSVIDDMDRDGALSWIVVHALQAILILRKKNEDNVQSMSYTGTSVEEAMRDHYDDQS